MRGAWLRHKIMPCCGGKEFVSPFSEYWNSYASMKWDKRRDFFAWCRGCLWHSLPRDIVMAASLDYFKEISPVLWKLSNLLVLMATCHHQAQHTPDYELQGSNDGREACLSPLLVAYKRRLLIMMLIDCWTDPARLFLWVHKAIHTHYLWMLSFQLLCTVSQYYYP